MEEAVPERPRDDEGREPQPADPVAEDAPDSQPAGPVMEGSPPAHPPEGQPSMPPAGEAPVESDEGPARMKARDLIAPSRHEAAEESVELEAPVKHAEVIAFANGKDAHERLQEEPFTLLLTDIVMPQMDGIELARRAAELDPQLKIMFITGFAAVTLNTNSRAPKNARVLSKPFHLKDLVREIDRLLAM